MALRATGGRAAEPGDLRKSVVKARVWVLAVRYSWIRGMGISCGIGMRRVQVMDFMVLLMHVKSL